MSELCSSRSKLTSRLLQAHHCPRRRGRARPLQLLQAQQRRRRVLQDRRGPCVWLLQERGGSLFWMLQDRGCSFLRLLQDRRRPRRLRPQVRGLWLLRPQDRH